MMGGSFKEGPFAPDTPMPSQPKRICLSFDEAVAVVSAAFNEDHDPDALESAIKRLGDWIDARLEEHQPIDPDNQEAM